MECSSSFRITIFYNGLRLVCCNLHWAKNYDIKLNDCEFAPLSVEVVVKTYTYNKICMETTVHSIVHSIFLLIITKDKKKSGNRYTLQFFQHHLTCTI